MTDTCPKCDSGLARQEGCVRCPACGWAACFDGGVRAEGSRSGRRLGPHHVPTITCKKCGVEHHYDARGGRCRECFAFLRDTTEAEDEKFTDFLVWNHRHRERESDDGGEP